MSVDNLSAALPTYAIDQRHNLQALISDTLLTPRQKWGCMLSCAYALHAPPLLIRALEAEAAPHLEPAARDAAKSAATLMAMNTVYYGAIALLDNHAYRSQPVGLSMSALAQNDVDKIDFELWAFAISALSNCGACLNAHEAELHKRGVTIERVQAALRIAATINAVATACAIEGIS